MRAALIRWTQYVHFSITPRLRTVTFGFGRNCIVGAGAVVTEGKEFPDNSLIIGAPAKVVRTLDEETAKKLAGMAQHYVDNSRRFGKGLKKVG